MELLAGLAVVFWIFFAMGMAIAEVLQSDKEYSFFFTFFMFIFIWPILLGMNANKKK